MAPRRFVRLLLAGLALLLMLAPSAAHQAGAAAWTYREMVVIPVDSSGEVANDCAGEPLDVSGHLLVNIHATEDPRGGYHFHFQIAAQHVTAIGQDSETVYQFPGGSSFTFNTNGEQEVRHYVNVSGHLAGPGPDNNMLYHLRTHYTINTNGEVTTEFDTFELTCNG